MRLWRLLELRASERGLRFHDPETGRDLPTHAEISAAQRQAEANWRQAEAERQQERTARRQAEARIDELEALLRERDAGTP